MGVDFGKVFGFALRYPLRKDVFFLLFTVNLIFGLLSWFVTGYLVGDAIGLEGAAALNQLLSSLIYLAPITIVSIIVTIFLIPLYFHNSMEFYKGKGKPIFESLGVAKERFFPLLLTLIIMMLILLACFGSVIVFSILFMFLGIQAGIAFLAIGVIWFLAGSVIGIIVFFMIFLAPVICVLEKAGPMDSIKKSWNIIMENKLNTFLFLIIFFFIYMLVILIGSSPGTIFAILAGQPQTLSLQSLAFFIFSMFFNVFASIFAYSVDVNYYLSIKKKTGIF